MSKRKVNYIGDSHSVLTFGQTLIDKLAHDVDLHLLGFSGLRLQYLTHWLDQKEDLRILNCEFKFRDIPGFSKDPADIGIGFKMNDADALVIALGTNDIVKCVESKLSYEKTLECAIAAELKQIAVETVIFIEPPILGIDKDKKIRNQLLAQIKSFGFMIVPCGNFKADQPDGIHMRKEMAQAFGESVSTDLLKLILPHH